VAATIAGCPTVAVKPLTKHSDRDEVNSAARLFISAWLRETVRSSNYQQTEDLHVVETRSGSLPTRS
jgi:hypothetical protein